MESHQTEIKLFFVAVIMAMGGDAVLFFLV
jgi:hypothetical protein